MDTTAKLTQIHNRLGECHEKITDAKYTVSQINFIHPSPNLQTVWGNLCECENEIVRAKQLIVGLSDKPSTHSFTKIVKKLEKLANSVQERTSGFDSILKPLL